MRQAVLGLAFGQTTTDLNPAAKFALPVDAQPGIFFSLQLAAMLFEPGVPCLGSTKANDHGRGLVPAQERVFIQRGAQGFLTYYYEYHFLYITGIEHVESKSIQGNAIIKLQFYPGTDMSQAMSETVADVTKRSLIEHQCD